MFNLSDVPLSSLGPLNSVVSKLVDAAQIDPSSLLLAGAFARDILHAGVGEHFTLRSTSDLDFG